MAKLKRVLSICIYPPHFRRTGSVALIVGTWLTLFNQGDIIWMGHLSGWIWVKVVLNFLTPFVVANLGLLSRGAKKREAEQQDEQPLS